MTMTRHRFEPPKDLGATPHQRVGLRQPVCRQKQLGEITQLYRHIGMIAPETLLTDRQSATHQRLSLVRPARRQEQLSEITQTDRHSGMTEPEAPFIDRKSSAYQGLR